jgi:hypothetical protein
MRRSKNFWGGTGAGEAAVAGMSAPFDAHPASAAPAAAAPSAASAARRDRSTCIADEWRRSAACVCIGYEDTPASATLNLPMASLATIHPRTTVQPGLAVSGRGVDQ